MRKINREFVRLKVAEVKFPVALYLIASPSNATIFVYYLTFYKFSLDYQYFLRKLPSNDIMNQMVSSTNKIGHFDIT